VSERAQRGLSRSYDGRTTRRRIIPAAETGGKQADDVMPTADGRDTRRHAHQQIVSDRDGQTGAQIDNVRHLPPWTHAPKKYHREHCAAGAGPRT